MPKLPMPCAACHHDDYLATTNPNHVAAQFPNDCASCHSEQRFHPILTTMDNISQFIVEVKKRQWTQCV